MNKMTTDSHIKKLVNRQESYFHSGATRPVEFRIQQLKKLKKAVKERENDFFEALDADFSKPAFETYGTEVGILYEEIDLYINNLSHWTKPQKVSSSIINFPSSDYIHFEPYGVSLVIGAWNYPILLSLQPVVSAIGAGNTVVLKPSEMASQTAQLLEEIIRSAFEPDFFSVVNGDADTAQHLLEQPFDYIFFTGSTRVGKLVMQAAAKNLTPVTLELGGKSPAIVDATADIKTAARRIAWGKFLNAGQTCVAPDYLLVEEETRGQLLEALQHAITDFYGQDPSLSPDYARIINDDHFHRLGSFLDNGSLIIGGETQASDRYIAPTILGDISWEDPIMQEEIFGPILPVLTFAELEEIIPKINDRPTPLALYLFSSEKEVQQKVVNQVAFGGGCINETIAHLGNPKLPFGGKGSSGMGNYHGKSGFDTFSHQKSVMKKATWLDIPFRYPPYGDKLQWLKKLFN